MSKPAEGVRLCRRELEILKIIEEHEAKGTEDPVIPVVRDKLGMSEKNVRKFLRVLMRKRVLPVSDEKQFPLFSYKLTPKQKQILAIVKEYWEVNGFAPSIADITNELGLRNRMSVREHLVSLRLKGVIDWDDQRRRTIQVVDKEGVA